MNNKMDNYPEVRVEKKNLDYANILSQDYAGDVSETTATMLYSYQHFELFNENKEFADMISEVSKTEMKHMELLGETIKLLGGDPIYKTCESINNSCIFWDASNVNYEKDIKKILLNNIEGEKKAITNYKHHKNIINDKYIKELLDRIIEDEYKHIRIFEEFYNRFTVK